MQIWHVLQCPFDLLKVAHDTTLWKKWLKIEELKQNCNFYFLRQISAIFAIILRDSSANVALNCRDWVDVDCNYDENNEIFHFPKLVFTLQRTQFIWKNVVLSPECPFLSWYNVHTWHVLQLNSKHMFIQIWAFIKAYRKLSYDTKVGIKIEERKNIIRRFSY